MRAQRMGRTDYAIKCFTEALAIQEDFETMGYLAQVYTQTNELDEAHKLLERMTEIEPEHTSTYLSLANVCYMQEDYPAMAGAAKKAIEIEEGNAMAHYLLGKADNGQGDGIMCIAHLTKAIVLKDDFIEARLLRAEALVQMQQYKEAMEDIDTILAQDPEDESAILLRGKIGCQPETNEEGHIVFKYQGDDFYIAVEDEARFIMIWNPWWASISMDNPALPYLKEIVNLVNVDSLVTTVFTADEDEKNVGLHSKCHTVFTPKEGQLDETGRRG